jgi:hypothetical protein
MDLFRPAALDGPAIRNTPRLAARRGEAAKPFRGRASFAAG